MRSDWNRRAREDAYYYVAFARPHQTTEEFQATASDLVALLEAELVRLPDRGDGPRRALDIGCGPARLMIPMSRHFDEIHGVDVSDEMIALGKKLLGDRSNAHLHVGNGVDLSPFEQDYFDFIYSCVVFQHVPVKEVVLGYLREAERVLKVGGVFCGQLRGLASGSTATDTWSGCSFSGDEVAEFVASRGLRLVGISGEGTQYMTVTLKKGAGHAEPDLSRAMLDAAVGPDGSSRVEERGCMSLWAHGLPPSSDLNDLIVGIGGTKTRGCYVSPIGPQGQCQLNVILPRRLGTGPARVSLGYRGSEIGNQLIHVAPAPPRSPRLGLVTDAVDLTLEFHVRSGEAKVIVQSVDDPASVTFRLDDKPARVAHYQCVDAVLDSYCYTVTLPVRAGRGRHTLRARSGAREMSAEVEID